MMILKIWISLVFFSVLTNVHCYKGFFGINEHKVLEYVDVDLPNWINPYYNETRKKEENIFLAEFQKGIDQGLYTKVEPEECKRCWDYCCNNENGNDFCDYCGANFWFDCKPHPTSCYCNVEIPPFPSCPACPTLPPIPPCPPSSNNNVDIIGPRCDDPLRKCFTGSTADSADRTVRVVLGGDQAFSLFGEQPSLNRRDLHRYQLYFAIPGLPNNPDNVTSPTGQLEIELIWIHYDDNGEPIFERRIAKYTADLSSMSRQKKSFQCANLMDTVYENSEIGLFATSTGNYIVDVTIVLDTCYYDK